MSLEKLEQKGLYLDFKCYENILKISVLFEKCHVFHKFSILSIKYEKRKRKKSCEQMYFSFFFVSTKTGYLKSKDFKVPHIFMHLFHLFTSTEYVKLDFFLIQNPTLIPHPYTDAVANVCSGEPAPQSMEVWATAPCWSPR